MLGFDVAAAIFLLACLPLLRVDDPADDAPRTPRPTTPTATMLLVDHRDRLGRDPRRGGGGDAGRRRRPASRPRPLIVATLLVAWLFANTIYALHYAHLYYERKAGGIDFPGEDPPGYADFVYFAFTLGMTFQTSDVDDHRPAASAAW